MKIVFAGLGNMGLPMAANLSGAGHEVIGYDTSPEAARHGAARGIVSTDDIHAAAQDVEAVLTMLPDGEAVSAFHAEIAPHLRPGTLLVDCSTIAVADARELAERAHAQGLQFLDAPVSGGTVGAEAGSLTFMIGGDAAVLEAARAILEPMAGRIVHCGDNGAGQAAKVCNNLMLGISMIAVCEAFALAERLGLSNQALFDVASTSSGQCWSLTSYCPVPGLVPTSPSNRDYAPGFTTALMAKDLNLAEEAAKRFSVQSPLGAHAASLYREFAEAGGAARDFSAVLEYLKSRSA